MCDSADNAIFRLDDIHFAYGQDARPVLSGASLALYPGQRLALYGPNGSGKTTLLRCITGLERPRSGTIFFHGRPLQKEKDFHALRCRVGFVLQNAEDQLFFPTVLEDVAFGPLNLGLPPRQARERAHEALCRLGLDGFEDRLTHRLSGGEKRLVALAAVLAMQPEALLLDEPTNDLDRQSRQRIVEILQGMDTARITISHDRDFLEAVSGEFLTISPEGKLRADAP